MWFLALLGCGAGPNEETLVPDVRVMAAVAEPPEVGAGESVEVAVHLFDPAGEGIEGVLWTCLDLGDGCLEAALPAVGASLLDPVDGVATVTRAVPAELAPLVADGTTVLPVPVWVLACAPGVCPLVAAVAAAPEPGTAEAEALAADLADPTAWMAELPIEGVSLGFTTVGVSARPEAERARNPAATVAAPGPYGVEVEGELEVRMRADLEVTWWAYTTLGGFDAPSRDADPDEEVGFTFYAPEEAGTAEVLFLAVTEDGGQTVWRTTIDVD